MCAAPRCLPSRRLLGSLTCSSKLCSIFEATSADIADLGEEHGHRVLRVCGKDTRAVPLPPAVGRAIDKAIGSRSSGPILLNRTSVCVRLRRGRRTALPMAGSLGHEP